MDWQTFRNQVLRTNLLDPDNDTFSNENVYDAYTSAVRTFASHTAKPVEQSFPGDGATTLFTLTVDPYEDLEAVGEVFAVSASGISRDDYYPIGMTEDAERWFETWQRKTLEVYPAPASGKTLKVRYYGIWNVPNAPDHDAFVLDVPDWAIGALKTLTAFYCYEGQGVQIANVVQWEDGIERNPWRKAAERLMSWYEAEIGRHQKQNRTRRLRRHG